MRVELFILGLTICTVTPECAPKNVKFVNFNKVPERNSTFVVKITAEKCPGFDDFYYKWEVKDINTSQVVQTSAEDCITIRGYNFTSDRVFEKDYQLTVIVSHNPDMSYSGSTSDIFRFRTAAETHIEKKGKEKRNHPFGENSEPSTEVSRHPSEDAFRYNKINLSTPGLNSKRSMEPPKVQKSDQQKEFIVENLKREILSVHETTPKIETVAPPALKIECVRNCKNTHPKEQTTLRVTCDSNCEEGKYKWSSRPSVEPDKTDLGDGCDTLVIKPGAYKEGDKDTVTVTRGSLIATYSLEFMKKMKKGKCEVTPKSGVSGVTIFKITCSDFFSVNGGLRYLIYQKSGRNSGVMVDIAESSECRVVLSEGTEIQVRAEDSAYLQEEVKLSVKVSPFPPGKNKTLLETIKEKVLVDLPEENSRSKIIQTMSFLLDAINSLDDVPDEVVQDLHKHIAESVLRVNPVDFTTAVQIMSVLTKLQECKMWTDTYTSRLIGKSGEITIKVMHDAVTERINSGKPRVPELLQQEFTKTFLTFASKLTEENPQIEETLEEETPTRDYDSYDEMTSYKLNIRHDLRDLTDRLLVSLQILFATLQQKTIPDEQPKTFKNKAMNVATRRIALETLQKNQIIQFPESSGSKVFVPETLIKDLHQNNSYLDYHFGVVKRNLFWWHPNSSKLNTEMVLFDFFKDRQKIKTLAVPFLVYLKTKTVPVGKITGNTTDNKIIAHRVEVEGGFSLVVVFTAVGDSYKATTSDCYCRNSDFDSGIEVKKGGNESERTLKVQPSQGRKVVYVCILKSGGPVTYDGNLAVFSCTYWDLKVGRWSSKGCSVKEATLKNGSFLVCECNHASLFAGQLFAPQNSLNLNSDIDFRILLLKNWGTLAILLTAILLWGLLFIMAAVTDKRHEKKNFVCKLSDNVPGDGHIYLLVVTTGFFIDAGTTADVAFQLVGDRGNSRVHLIKCDGAELLQQSSQDWLVIYTPEFLGKILKIRLWHNCRGRKPHWYCSKIIVQHLKSGEQYFFPVEKWFSLVWGNGKIYWEIFPINMFRLKSRKLLFRYNLKNQFADGHLWLSVFMRDPQSNFSSLERVGTAACAFFVSMLASAFFYGIPKNAPGDSIDPRSSYFITYHDLVVFFESWLVAVPVGIGVMLAFRNSASSVYSEICEGDCGEKIEKKKNNSDVNPSGRSK